MGQTYDNEIAATQGLTPAALDITNNFESIRSSFSGATPPSSPAAVAGQKYHCTSTGGGYTTGVTYIYNGTTWEAIGMVGGAAPGSVGLLATVTGINGKSATTTVLPVNPPGTLSCVVDRIELEVTAATAVASNPDMGAGVAAGEDDVCASTSFSLFSAVSAAGQIFTLMANPISRVIANSDTLKLGIDVAATGTTLTMTARVYGKSL